jgi:hypothetical protein
MFADSLRVEMPAVRARKRAMVSDLNDVYLEKYKQTGAEFILGSARFVEPKTVEVVLRGGTTRRLSGANVTSALVTRAPLKHGAAACMAAWPWKTPFAQKAARGCSL